MISLDILQQPIDRFQSEPKHMWISTKQTFVTISYIYTPIHQQSLKGQIETNLLNIIFLLFSSENKLKFDYIYLLFI